MDREALLLIFKIWYTVQRFLNFAIHQNYQRFAMPKSHIPNQLHQNQVGFRLVRIPLSIIFKALQCAAKFENNWYSWKRKLRSIQMTYQSCDIRETNHSDSYNLYETPTYRTVVMIKWDQVQCLDIRVDYFFLACRCKKECLATLNSTNYTLISVGYINVIKKRQLYITVRINYCCIRE